jgi:predicted Zn-dependent protease
VSRASKASRRSRKARPHVARYAAPVAFLLGVTIAVLLIRSALGGGGGNATTTAGSVTHPSGTVATTTKHGSSTAPRVTRFYTVQGGDTFGSISAKTGTSIAELERLNPGVSSNTLQVGQKLRVK